jgi:hypothetical protein
MPTRRGAWRGLAIQVQYLSGGLGTGMKIGLRASGYLLLGSVLAISAWGQTGAGKDIGSGAGDVGKGAAKGVGSAAKGTAKGVGDVVTLHPVSGAKSVGKGAAGAGKDVTVGTAKGTGKIARGIGKTFKKIF